MRTFLIMLSMFGLALTILPSVMVFAKLISFELHISLMAMGTLLWFVTAPMWMKKQDEV